MPDNDAAYELTKRIKAHPERLGPAVGFNDLTPLHGKWIRKMVFGGGDYTLQAHRGSFKSSCLAIAISLLLILRKDKNIILLTEAEEEEQRLREELAVVELKVGAVLAKLSEERLYDFMVNRFLDFMTIEAAANEVGFSYSWGRLAVERSVAEVQEILDGMEADGEFEGGG